MESKVIPTEDQYLDLYAIKKGYRNAIAMAMYLPLLDSIKHVKIAMHEYAVLFAKHHVEKQTEAIKVRVLGLYNNSISKMHITAQTANDALSDSINTAYLISNIK